MLEKHDELLILEPIKQYFTTYYENIKTGTYQDVSRWFILNDDTVIPQRWIQNKFKLYNAFNLWIKEYLLDLKFSDICLYKDHASVTVLENAEYSYKQNEEVKSKISDIEYRIMLKKIDDLWKIIYVDSDHEAYRLAYERQDNTDRAVLSDKKGYLTMKGNALNRVFDDLDDAIYELMLLSPKKDQYPESVSHSEKGSTTLGSTFSYHPVNGVHYAREYADYKRVSEDRRLFYFAPNGSDCANFVSQCVWAAYGGYVQGNIELTKKNIANKVRMVKTGNPSTSWYGTGVDGGGTPYWENVNQFYKYATMAKGVGPNGNGYGECIQSEFNFAEVTEGDVLQFWKESQNKWYHSTYVSSVGEMGQVERIYVCQHTINIIDRPLIDLLIWNTNEGKLRGIHFTDGAFSQ